MTEEQPQELRTAASVDRGEFLEAQVRGEIDVQISTAKKYPRSIKLFIDQATEMATLDEETAASCFYSIPRAGKSIEGASVRLAELAASAWGHMRVESRIVGQDDRFVTVKGMAWDLQNNVAISAEARRRITDSQGRKYNDDMILVTAMAASAIVRRNAILSVIPRSYTDKLWKRCRQTAVGDVKTLGSKRAGVLDALGKMGVTLAMVLAFFGVPGVEDLGLEELGILMGLGTGLREGTVTVEEAFPPKEQPAAPAEAKKGATSKLKEKLMAETPKGDEATGEIYPEIDPATGRVISQPGLSETAPNLAI